MMRDVDSGIELVACGSCATGLATYMDWDREVLEYLGDYADYISLHRYVGNDVNDTADFLAITNSIDRQIEDMDAVCRFVQARRRSKARTYLCFDEWNVWYRARGSAHQDGMGRFAPHLIEEVYNLEDALVVAGFLNSFIRHADVLKIANLAQLVNVIAPLLTRGDQLLVQSIYYPFAMFARRREGVALQAAVSGPTYEGRTNGEVTVIDSSAILNGDTLHVFLTNRSLDQSATVRIRVEDRAATAIDSAEIVTGEGPAAANSFERPNAVTSRAFSDVTIVDGAASAVMPPLAAAAVSLRLC